MKIFTIGVALTLIAGMASAQSYRLVAESEYSGTGAHFIPQDSTAYYYNNPLVNNNYSEADLYIYNGGTYDSDEVYYQSFYPNKLVDTLFALTWSSYHARYINKYIVLNFYDASNNDTTQIQQIWDSTTQQYINYYKQTYIYNTNGDVTLNLAYTYNTAWRPSAQYGYTFNSHNKNTSQTYAVWNVSAWDTALGFYFRILFNYNAKGEDTLGINLTYNYNTLSWDTSNRLLLTFDKNRTLDSIEVVQSWNSNLPTWQNANEYILYYDANGNDTATYSQVPNGNLWINYNRVLSTYDANNYLTSEKIRYWNDSGSYQATTSAYERFWYYGAYAGINQLSVNNDQLSVYPNPTANILHFSMALGQTQPVWLHLYNMLGQQVWSATTGMVTQYTGVISVANLPTGSYLLELRTANSSATQQVMVTR